MTRLLCLGDSYTIGEGVDVAEAWPALVASHLGLSVGVIAATGWTVSDLLSALDEPITGADVVTVLIGVNDQYDGTAVTAVLADLDRILDRATRLAGTRDRVLIISIPDWSVTPFAADRDRDAVAEEIESYNQALRSVSTRRGHAFVDLTPHTRLQGDLVVDDGLHPSPGAHADWSASIGPAIKSALRPTDT